MSVPADEGGGGRGHQVTSDNVSTWSQAGTIPAHGWHRILCVHWYNVSRPRHQQEGSLLLLQCRRIEEHICCHNSFQRQIENCCYQKTHILEVITKLKANTEKSRSPVWVQIPVSNPVLINSTIKFVFLNDRQDVEIRMLCGYWIVWEQDQVALPDSIAIFFVLSLSI